MSDHKALIAELVKLGNDVDEFVNGVPAEIRAAIVITEQDAVIQSIRVAAGQKDWQWVYDALTKTQITSTECQ